MLVELPFLYVYCLTCLLPYFLPSLSGFSLANLFGQSKDITCCDLGGVVSYFDRDFNLTSATARQRGVLEFLNFRYLSGETLFRIQFFQCRKYRIFFSSEVMFNLNTTCISCIPCASLSYASLILQI